MSYIFAIKRNKYAIQGRDYRFSSLNMHGLSFPLRVSIVPDEVLFSFTRIRHLLNLSTVTVQLLYRAAACLARARQRHEHIPSDCIMGSGASTPRGLLKGLSFKRPDPPGGKRTHCCTVWLCVNEYEAVNALRTLTHTVLWMRNARLR
jgi:hypothetical protein